MTLPTRTTDDRAAAFERAATAETRRLFGVALTILGDHGEAEDAVQETLFSAWRKWSSLRDPSRRSAWLTQICVNQCVDRRRRLIRRVLWSTDQWSAATTGDPPILQDSLLGFNKAFRNLSRSQRAAFALHFYHGYSLDECAELLGCRPGTARSHLGRAVAKLRKEFSDV